MKKLYLLSLIVGIFLTAPNNANAVLIINTDQPFASGSGTIGGFNHFLFDTSQQFAMEFDFDQPYLITDIESFIIRNNSSGGPQTYHIAIYSDGGEVPDANNELFSTVVSSPLQINDGYQWDGAHGLAWNLSSGTYWVGFEPRGSELDTFGGFIAGPSSNPLQNYAFRLHAGGPFDDIYLENDGPAVSLRIQGESTSSPNVVPEPATLALFATGLLGAFARRRIAETPHRIPTTDS